MGYGVGVVIEFNGLVVLMITLSIISKLQLQFKNLTMRIFAHEVAISLKGTNRLWQLCTQDEYTNMVASFQDQFKTIHSSHQNKK